MNDMSGVIVPRSDQWNADSFLAGPQTFTIREVKIKGGQEQPVSIYMEGSDLAYRPCKSMSRCLVAAWGPDASKYVGRSLTLYCDPTIKWGGMQVGGIRISHMSHIDREMVMALTATKGQRKPFMVKPMPAAKSGSAKPAQKTAEAPADRKPSDATPPDEPVYEVRNALGEVTEMVTAPVYLVAMDKLFAEAAQGGNEQEFLAVFEQNAETIDTLPADLKTALRDSYKRHKAAVGGKKR